MEEKKVCPFRRDKSGEFSPCYGEKCMAYYEYDMPAFPIATQNAITPPPTRMKGCYLTAPISRNSYPVSSVTYSGGCF